MSGWPAGLRELSRLRGEYRQQEGPDQAIDSATFIHIDSNPISERKYYITKFPAEFDAFKKLIQSIPRLLIINRVKYNKFTKYNPAPYRAFDPAHFQHAKHTAHTDRSKRAGVVIIAAVLSGSGISISGHVACRTPITM